jgi:cytochrome c556
MKLNKLFTALLLIAGGAIFSTAEDDSSIDKQALDKKTDRLSARMDKADRKLDKLADKNTDKADRTDKKTDKSTAEKKGGRKIQGENRERVKAYLDTLPADEKKRLMELYQQDPDKLRKEIGSKIYDLKKQDNSHQKIFGGLVEKYNAAQTPAEKQKYRDMLKEASKKEFSRNLERSKTELDTLEKRLNTLRQTYENRKNNADKIVDDQVEYLTRDPSLHW